MPEISVLIKPVSSLCNMRCRYCFYSDVSNRREIPDMGIMSGQTLENLVRRVISYADGTATFAFQGGEPTLAGIEFFRKVTELQKKYNSRHVAIRNSVQTNGYDLSDELLEFFKREEFLLGVSYDGIDQTHDQMRIDPAGNGTSGRVKDTIRRMQKTGVDFNVLCVVNNYTVKHPKEIFKNLSRYGYIQFIPCLDGFDGEKKEWSLREEEYLVFLKKMFDLYYQAFTSGNYVSIRDFDNYVGIILGRHPENCGMCGVCARYYLVEADGSVYPCDFYVLDEYKLGNINNDSIFRLEKSEVQRKFIDDSLIVQEECKTCRWKIMCRGGCRRNREPFVNGLPSRNIHCETYRQFFDYSYQRMCKMAEILTRQHGKNASSDFMNNRRKTES